MQCQEKSITIGLIYVAKCQEDIYRRVHAYTQQIATELCSYVITKWLPLHAFDLYLRLELLLKIIIVFYCNN